MVSLAPRHSQWPTRPESRAICRFVEPERFADLARGRAAAIADDVGRHGRAQRAVALVDVLDDLLTVVARGQIEIDVGPLAAVLAEESLEEQLHAHWIDGGNFQRITDRGIRRRSAALHKKTMRLAVADDVPHDEEVSGKAELGNQRQLMLYLRTCLVKQVLLVVRAITLAHAFFHTPGQKAVHGLALGQRDTWEIRSQDCRARTPAVAHNACIGDGLGKITKEPCHLACAAKRTCRSSPQGGGLPGRAMCHAESP